MAPSFLQRACSPRMKGVQPSLRLRGQWFNPRYRLTTGELYLLATIFFNSPKEAGALRCHRSQQRPWTKFAGFFRQLLPAAPFQASSCCSLSFALRLSFFFLFATWLDLGSSLTPPRPTMPQCPCLFPLASIVVSIEPANSANSSNGRPCQTNSFFPTHKWL
jgi:hypothetical protein